ncbi:MAG: 3-hydroxyacyl-CoA dehydrogenase NAD-binding domain-containing protein [Chloroflexota bacterium]|nr:3-hydroxyacyl-CoA dehydrogenase NAD-binding domain-containing protein [Chloroflexota bacterium]
MTDTPAIRRIAVIGAGLMGHGIALEFAANGYDVHLQDQSAAQLAQAEASIAEGLGRLVAAGRITATEAAAAPGRISLTSSLPEAVRDADVVIEAVTENIDVKRAIFSEIDAHAPRHAILASNSSTFMPSLMAAVTTRPEQVLVAHYFNPPHLLPLVELVRGEKTSDATIAAMHALYTSIGKSPAIVQKEAPGFVGNRLQMALYREALAIVEAGIASPQDVDTIIHTGFGRRLSVAGVFQIFDAAGLDVTLAVADQLFPDIATTNTAPPLLRDKVAQGDLGIKSGRGFYDWPPDDAVALRTRIGNALAAIARLESPGATEEPGSNLDPAVRKKILRAITYGLYAVTAHHNGERGVFTANWLSQASFDPPVVMLSVENDSSTLPLIAGSGRFVICPFTAEQRDLAAALGKPKARAGDKFDALDLEIVETAGGDLALAHTLGYIVCQVRDTVPAGDSVVFVADVIEIASFSEDAPLEMRVAGFRHSG